jgi:uncharacterized protein (TIGR02145 family)
MNKIKLAFIASVGILFFACGIFFSTDVDFSIVPVEGSNGEYQYIDLSQNGKIVINPQFSKAHVFRSGLALVKNNNTNGKYGYIDKKGKYVIAPTYDYAQSFSEGVAWVQLEDQSPMLIDNKGKILMQIDSLTQAYPFANDISKVSYYSQGHVIEGFINKNGEVVITAAEGEKIGFMNDGLYAFKNDASKKWGVKNKHGEIVINEQFDSIDVFFDGVAGVKAGEKYGAINKKGEYVVNPQYDELGYDSDGLLWAKVGKKYGWINKKGDATINVQFDEFSPFYGNKLASVKMGKWAYVDKKGQIIINPQFDLASPFFGDYALVLSDGKIGFIDKKGDYVVQPLYKANYSDIVDYVYALQQSLFGFAVPEKPTGYFLRYKRLDEKKEEYRERVIAAASGSFIDSRDDKTYKTIRIGTQNWMAENLNYAEEGKCYGNDPDNCQKYGKLFNWATAKKVCPSGWHLPSKDEWQALADFAGGDNFAGKKLRAKNGWDKSSGGTDDYGFAILPGGEGYSYGSFKSVGSFAYLWSATESSAIRAYTVNLDKNYDKLRWDSDDKSNLATVRCIQDYATTTTAAETVAGAETKSSVNSFTDSRDGAVYKSVKIGNQTWMAENLNYSAIGECYDNDPANCQKYGKYFSWTEAKKACPSGWHLPSNAEWDALYRTADGSSGTESPYKSETAGKKLKAARGWNSSNGESGNGGDSYGFAALPGGSYYSEYNHAGNNGYWWSSSEFGGDKAYYRFMLYDGTAAGWNKNSKTLLLNVRCVKD